MKRHTTRKRNRKAVRRAVMNGVRPRMSALFGNRIVRKEAIRRNRQSETKFIAFGDGGVLPLSCWEVL